MTERRSRAAVIGLGPHGLRHLQAYERLGNVDVVAVCDIRQAQMEAVREQLPKARGYTDWQRLLKEERLDVISVVTNGPSHAAVTNAAAKGGIGRILCEKPMATSVRDAREMVRVCRANGTRLAVAHA